MFLEKDGFKTRLLYANDEFIDGIHLIDDSQLFR